ncbi:MAG TPA: acyl-CoA dehydrogenase family protein [Acidimicrobiia bacterium]|nr:acyl-CoA dehydrogenase family protein [Acidimicrobiia bacterium]
MSVNATAATAATGSEAPAAEGRDILRRVDELLAAHPPGSTAPKAFLEAQFDAGLAWVHFPEGAGGLGLAPKAQRTIDQALAQAGAPMPDVARNIIGQGMAAPTIAVHGTPEQRVRYLRPLFSGEEIWCQLFSEPGSGSDLAGLATRAVRDGDEWIVNGQKVWTTLGHIARFGLLVARTDAELPKHRGLTYFICDMQAEGVDVRPLRQLTGDAEFNEVYLSDVRLSDDLRLGGEGEGWRVAMTTLMNERVSIGGGRSQRGSGAISVAVGVWKAAGHDDPARRDQLMRLWVAAEVNRLTNIRAGQMRRTGTPGPEGSVAKLTFAELNQAISELCVDLMGAEGQLYADYDNPRRESVGFWTGDPRYFFLRARANSIEGGTSEVLRNILGERVLGLPGEPRGDKDLPWRDVPRS